MVADNDLKKYGELFNEIHKEQGNEEKGSRTVELFFSFDIVNSSSYKDTNFDTYNSLTPNWYYKVLR